jgi:hypothetical protein
MAIYYMDTKIIGRSSGRSAVGAAAYRRSAKMQSVAHAAYHRGKKIHEIGENITHDYRSKSGVVHSEIMLPDDAPLEFMDSETLWNTVEAKERRKDSQLAREIIVALPREFNLNEQIEVMRDYVKENFVSKGMIADFSIHDNEGNPHAHIMLTMRHVSQKGFGLKNTDWNKKEFLLSYRKSWAHIINIKLAQKGLDERIDHRSLKEQGVDRLPYIHMGHEATALERKGIRTRKGDYNREIRRHNEELAAGAQNQTPESAQPHAANLNPPTVGVASGDRNKKYKLAPTNTDNAVSETRAALMKVHWTLWQQENESKKKPQIIEQMQTPFNESLFDTQEMEVHLLYKERITLVKQNNEHRKNITKFDGREESIDEGIRNIKTLQDGITKLKSERQKSRLWEGKRKKLIDRELERAEEKLRDAQCHFWIEHRITPNEAPEVIRQIQNQRSIETAAMEANNTRIAEIMRDIDAIESEYHTQEQIAAPYQIHEMYEQTWETPETELQAQLNMLKMNAIIIENTMLDIIEELDRTRMKTQKRSRPRGR